MAPPDTLIPAAALSKSGPEDSDRLSSAIANTSEQGPNSPAQRLNDFTDQLEFLMDWRDELAWRIAKAEFRLVWMERREFDALVEEVQSWRAACELTVGLAKASEPEAPFHD